MATEQPQFEAVDLRLPRRGLRMDGSRFWVIHRRREYGPFDYEWSHDLRGLSLLYQGVKFGEICSEDEIFADLKEFKLPMSVVKVASLTLGCQLYSIRSGLNPLQRDEFLRAHLVEHGCSAYLPPRHA